MIINKELKIIQKILPRLFKIVEVDFLAKQVGIKFKGDSRDIVTKTDLKIHRFLLKTINKYFPNDTVLSEESHFKKQEKQKRLWVLDPLCGTSNFSAGFPFFCTNITLFEQSKPIFSLVIDYPKKTYYWATKNKKGVYQETQKVASTIKPDRNYYINTDQGSLCLKEFKNSTKLNQYAYLVNEFIKNQYLLISAASSLSFAYVALGQIGGLIASEVEIWDIAAAAYLIEKNGGVVTDFLGNSWSLKTKDFIASLDKNIYTQILQILKKTRKA